MREVGSETLPAQPSSTAVAIEQRSSPTATRTSIPNTETPVIPSVVEKKTTKTPHFIPVQTSGLEITPYLPVKGSADKIAFLHDQEIWMANIDGREITQLTDDGYPKASLRWSPDSMGVIYISGSCAIRVDIYTAETTPLVCFEEPSLLEAFEISPDSNQVAISLDRQLFILPFDRTRLQTVKSSTDLVAMANCPTTAPYKHRQSVVTVKSARWSADGNRLAIVRQAFDADRLVDIIHILDLSACTFPLHRLDEFPATRFNMEGYAQNPILQNFAWDGNDLFAVTSYRRNDGFGDLWIYSYELHRGFLANPVEGKCCYRDPIFSPDGEYLAFVFQDAQIAPHGPAQLYYIPFDAVDTSMVFPPIQLPRDFFTDPRVKPQPALRAAP